MPDFLQDRSNPARPGRWLILPALFVLFAALSAWPGLNAARTRNSIAITTVQGLDKQNPAMLQDVKDALASMSGEGCWQPWTLGIVHNALGDLENRNKAWEQAMHCSPAYIFFTRNGAYKDLDLAQVAVQAYPERAEAWFWLAELHLAAAPGRAIHAYWQGLQRQPHNHRAWAEMGRAFGALPLPEALKLYGGLGIETLSSGDPLLRSEPKFIMATILAKEQPDRAIQLYRQGLEAKPYDGVRWYELGDLLAETDPHAALAAYHQSCHNGDPGSHGCYGAGLMAEEIGDIPLAVQYYRQSRWENAQQRADELEGGLP